MSTFSVPALTGIPEFHEVVFEAIPSPVFVLDSGLGVIDFNSAAAGLVQSAVLEEVRRGYGDIVHCVNAGEVGCGRGPGCHACVIRSSVQEVFAGAEVCRKSARISLRRDGEIVESDQLVTVSPFLDGNQAMALLIVEDMNEMERLIATLKPAPRARTAGASA